MTPKGVRTEKTIQEWLKVFEVTGHSVKVLEVRNTHPQYISLRYQNHRNEILVWISDTVAWRDTQEIEVAIVQFMLETFTIFNGDEDLALLLIRANRAYVGGL